MSLEDQPKKPAFLLLQVCPNILFVLQSQISYLRHLEKARAIDFGVWSRRWLVCSQNGVQMLIEGDGIIGEESTGVCQRT